MNLKKIALIAERPRLPLEVPLVLHLIQPQVGFNQITCVITGVLGTWHSIEKYLRIENYCIDKDVTPLENLRERDTSKEIACIVRWIIFCLLWKANWLSANQIIQIMWMTLET